ncbi:cellulose biosynthesis protein BcsG [Yokenella regensburgei]|uniref:Cellulose synthase operon protein YhjU n=1 Tax=Yokenella regensburgei TaxID=158877 RepID=A0AB38FZ37_9ENTR|nr:cellulose biosynthesis protein BcsG [Yokenella regensburgei]KFD24591.1 putative inner membrane protein [Yokenella regensburgei ATCC 49455]MDQ4429966.1 cellulose biosynthesis protein BcsG [Yokenella regensburgei]SQA64331.1 cellulose synthase operon protein YhjU [Yokenella regensburgei]SQB01930.1 cellulose synthase operon protein YhjU [Yokenella regensburgei]SUQ03319.1 cellulose synthase operon protein YhjU [Yokenella regensburgei]
MTKPIKTATAPSPLWQYWRGLSGWNFYFLVKFGLLWAGYLNFHAMQNLVFMAFLLVPLPNIKLHKLRNWIAIPIGFALFWHDTWLPGPESIMSQGSQIAGFSADYVWDLVTRFINWQMVGAFFVLLVAWLFLSQWIRVTVFVVAIMVWLNLLTITGPVFSLWPAGQPTSTVTTTGGSAAATVATAGDNPVVGDIPAQTAPPTSANLNAWLASFYAAEDKRKTTFPAALPEDAQPFELLVINICSLSWSDIEAAGLMQHPLWAHFDILFKNFNSATSYSGPAAIRLLRASCGQQSHVNLYQPGGNQCYLFDNLAKLGFTEQLMLGHDGKFGDFLKEVRNQGGMQAPLMDQKGLPVSLLGFDGSPVYDDLANLNRWLDKEKQENGRTATFFNTLPLHDGNHFPGQSKTADYKARAQKMFDELDQFFTELEKSGRKVMVVVVPEHGGALKGDKMQVSGLRDIPSPAITNVPAAVKFFGMKAPHQGPAIEITKPSSYLAISELVARAVDGKMFTEDSVNWQQYTSNLPQTAPVSENSNAIVIEYQGKPYVRLNGGDWVPYPQ